MGRLAWLFAGSGLAGQRAAIVMSLVQSAELNGHEPSAYLRDVLERLPSHPKTASTSCYRTAGRSPTPDRWAAAASRSLRRKEGGGQTLTILWRVLWTISSSLQSGSRRGLKR